MQLHLTGRNLEITPALKTFTEEKLSRLQTRFNNILTINVILHIEKLSQIAEATVHVDGSDIHAKAEAVDMYAAIDELFHKLLSQVTKHKQKLEDHR